MNLIKNDSFTILKFLDNLNDGNLIFSEDSLSSKTIKILKELYDRNIHSGLIKKTGFRKIKSSNKKNLPKILQYYQYLIKHNEFETYIKPNEIIDTLIKDYSLQEEKTLYKISNYLQNNNKILLENLYNILDSGIVNLNDVAHIDSDCKDIYGTFCTIEVQKYIETNISYIHEFKTFYKSNQITFIIGTKNENIEIDVSNIFKAVFLILEYSCSNNKNILIKFWDTDLKKYFNDKCETIGSSQVNTAVTKFYDNFSINIWRREELLKVILHELMHHLNLDFYSYPSFINQYLYRNLNISPEHDIKIYEAYVETWATILHLIYFTKFSNINKDLNLDFKNFIEDYWNIEKNFMCFQVAKILNHFNFRKINDFFNPNWNFIKKYKCHYKESSSIISYYIIKTSFFVNIDKFIDFCNNGELILNFGSSITRSKEFIDLIDYCLNSCKFKKYVSFYLNKILKDKNCIKNSFPMNTFRMTLLEIEN